MSDIIKKAIEKYNPIHALILFSGGHDSLCMAYFSIKYLSSIGFPFTVYHGNTGTGIKRTRQFVEDVASQFGWNLVVNGPADGTYMEQVKKYGFPGPSQHSIIRRELKEKPLRKYVSHVVKSSVYARENVLLLSGVRKSESLVRMGYVKHTSKENSQVWCNPIFYWTEQDCSNYIKENKLPRNPVKDKICISGECLCGCYAKKSERAEIKAAFPEKFKEIEKWENESKLAGFNWKWGERKADYLKHNPPGQINMFSPMCVRCDAKNMNQNGQT